MENLLNLVFQFATFLIIFFSLDLATLLFPPIFFFSFVSPFFCGLEAQRSFLLFAVSGRHIEFIIRLGMGAVFCFVAFQWHFVLPTSFQRICIFALFVLPFPRLRRFFISSDRLRNAPVLVTPVPQACLSSRTSFAYRGFATHLVW